MFSQIRSLLSPRCPRANVPWTNNTIGLTGMIQPDAAQMQHAMFSRHYDAAYTRRKSLRDNSARGGTRTPTGLPHRILNPARLPIPPLSRCEQV